MDNNRNRWRKFLSEKSRIKNYERILQILQKYRDTVPHMERPDELPMEIFCTLAMQYEDEAFLVADNQQDYTGLIAQRLLWLEKKLGLVTPAINHINPAILQLGIHQLIHMKTKSQTNQNPGAESSQTASDHLNGRTLNSSHEVQIPMASTGENGGDQLPGAFSRQPHEDEELSVLLQFMQFEVNPSRPFLEDMGTSSQSLLFL